jgi:outer membrane protein/adhesin transport system outer membrane protein
MISPHKHTVVPILTFCMSLLVQTACAQMMPSYMQGPKNIPKNMPKAALSVPPQNCKPEKLTLNDALAEAYRKNPDLEAVRAELRSVDENYVQALAGFKPSLDGVADYTSTHRPTGSTDPKSLSLAVTQPLYNGGSTMAGVDQAESTIKAGRAKLKVTEQQVLLNAVTAYMNLLRDQQIVELDLNNEKVLARHLEAARERFKLGSVTKTDVSQAQSRYDRAVADRITVEGNMKKSRAAFEQVIGLPPEHLQKPVFTMNLPRTEDEAIMQGLDRNPAITLAKYNEAAAKATTRSLEGANLPQVALTGSVARIYNPADTGTLSSENAKAVEVRATIPLYAGGSITSKIRQSRQTENQFRMQAQSADRVVREAVVQAWEGLAAANAESQALKSQIESEKLALEGVHVEMNYGTRTTLDLLDAQQEYLVAQVSYVGAETDRIIAAYALLSATGRLTAEDMKLDVPVYNPAENFQKLSRKTFGGEFHGDK